jgi:glycolate oxidase
VQFSDEEREQMLAFKAAFDPKGLLNPGKTVPMLARCGELRGVRRTATLDKVLADLPRF